jgi:predicted phage tail protein
MSRAVVAPAHNAAQAGSVSITHLLVRMGASMVTDGY